MATSSAYATTLQPPSSRIRRSLFTAIFHRRGDSTPPLWVSLFTSLVWVEVPSVAVTILLISNLWINPTIGGSTPSSVRDSVIAVRARYWRLRLYPGRRSVCIPCFGNENEGSFLVMLLVVLLPPGWIGRFSSTSLWLFVMLVGCDPVLSRPVPAISMVWNYE